MAFSMWELSFYSMSDDSCLSCWLKWPAFAILILLGVGEVFSARTLECYSLYRKSIICLCGRRVVIKI